MKFLKDEEINLKSNDLLNTKTYADCLVEVIKNAPSKFTIGLFGEWGSGKSSIIKTTKDELEKDKALQIKFITYDAWKYANDSFRRTFLFEMTDSLDIGKDKRQELFTDFYTNQNKDTQVIKQKNYAFMSFSFLIFLVIFITSLVMEINTSTALTIQTFIGLLILGIHFYKNSTDDLKMSISEPLFFAPEQFEECFNELVDKTLNKSTLNKWFHPFSKNYKQLVIVIDNIDRCDKQLSYELLTNIKNFLGDKDNVTFIIPLDNNALKRHLKINDSSEKEADEFLRKFFNVALTIKPFKSLDLYDYTNDLNTKEGLNLRPDSIGIIADEYASNPRRIIQILNNLSTEFRLLGYRINDEFVTNNESLIVLIVILREEWNEFYNYIFLQPHMIRDILNDYEITEFKDDEKLKLFLHRTKGITNNIDIILVENILYNKSNHKEVSTEIIESLNKNETDAIAVYLEDEKNYFNLMKYLIDKLKLEILRKTFKTGALSVFEDILKVNILHNIEKHHNILIYGLFSNDNTWLSIINNLNEKSVRNFFTYVNSSDKQNMTLLKTISFTQFKNIWSKDRELTDSDPKLWTTYLENFINETDDVSTLKKLKGAFRLFYIHHFIHDENSLLFDNKWISEDKISHIIGDGLVDSLIEKLEFNITDNNYFSELLYLSEQNIIQIKHIEKIIQKLGSLSSIVDSGSLLLHIEELTKIFSNITIEEKNIDNILTYTNSLVDNRTGLNSNNQQVPINLLNELSDDEEKIRTLLRYYLEIYRMTNNNTNVVPLCVSLFERYPSKRNILYASLIVLRDEHNSSLEPFFEFLLNQESISDDILEIYSKIFIYPDISIEKVEKKLRTYITNIINKNNDLELVPFIDQLINNKNMKDIITKFLKELRLEEIKALSVKTQSLAYDSFNEDIALVENDISILKDMLKEKIYVENIIGVIIGKLQYKTKIKDALKIIEDIQYLSEEQKNSLLTELEKRKGGEKLDDSVDFQIKRLKSDF